MNPLEQSSFMVIKNTPKVEVRDGRPHMSNREETTTISESCYVMDLSGKWYIEVLMNDNGTLNVRAHGAESLIIKPYPSDTRASSPKKKKEVKFKENPVPKNTTPPILKRHSPPLPTDMLENAGTEDSNDRSSSNSAYKIESEAAMRLENDVGAELLELVVKEDAKKGVRPDTKAMPKSKDHSASQASDTSQTEQSANSLPFNLLGFKEVLQKHDDFKEGVTVRKGCLVYLSPDDKLLYMHFTKNKDGNNQMNFNLGNARRRNSVEFASAGWEPYYSESVLKSSVKDLAQKIYAEFMMFIAESC
jgi:hypothetical protein